MFLIEDKRHGVINLVFTWEDPRKSGYGGHVIEDVTLDYDMEKVHRWLDGEARPEACVGRAPDNSKHYKVFKYRTDLEAAGYQFVPGMAAILGSWKEYLKIQLLPPDPDQTEDEPYYEYLDKLDEDSRHRRERVQAPEAPSGKNRDDVAAWVARTHLIADSGVREVWYLPRGAPPEEIRLLELNDRLAGPESSTEALDFGLEVDGTLFRLYVADITGEQLDRIKQDPGRLPSGWSLEENRIWRRGA
jgi:hypothetical protein